MANRSQDAISIELTPSQVGEVARAAREAGSMTVLLCEDSGVGGSLGIASAHLDDPRLSRSLLTGLLLLASLPADGSSISNAKLAQSLEVSPSTCHRYLTTLLEAGLVERDPPTRRYRRPLA